MAEAKRKLAAILAADVAGYSRLMGADEEGTVAALDSCRAVFRDNVSDRGGRIVDTAGDSVLAVFDSAVEAVRCALELQTTFGERNTDRPTDACMWYRIGINLGDVIEKNDGTIYGDGVNIAARLEALAAPGSVVISASTHEQIEGKMEARFEYAGEHTVKNIARPIQAYAIAHGHLPAGDLSAQRTTADKPSIAVLPFDNMSTDADQSFFADGITEDIITELSRFSDLFVIARNSTFAFKGQAVNVQQAGRVLGARYIVEGSVRRAGNRVRLTVQLVESETAGHLWAERYDRELTDIFEIQDELTRSIVGILPGRIHVAEANRVKRTPPRDMVALDYVHAGRIHHHRVTQSDNAEAVRLLDKAIELDPDFAEAYAWKACALGQALQFGFCDDFQSTEQQAIAAVKRALSLDPSNVECHRLLCEVSMQYKQLEKAATHCEQALSLNPNDPRIVAQKGELSAWLGQSEDGIEWIEKALRLDPLGAPNRMHLLGRALYGARRYKEAADAYAKLATPRYGSLAELAACYGQIGDGPKAREAAGAVLEAEPKFTVTSYVSTLPFEKSEDRDHLAAGLMKAGLPERST